MPTFVLAYEYQTCFDDGGLGHDAFWRKSKHSFEADDYGAAVEYGNNFIKEHDGRHPCNGSFCSNRGGYRFVEVHQLGIADLVLRG